MFLATTALSEFWDKNQQILFLGSWCLRYDQRSEWESLKYQVMPCPWDNRRRFYDASLYLDRCYELVLSQLTDYLNSVHGVSYSQRYWRILVGPWLLHYLHAVYDRYIHLVVAFDEYPALETVVLDAYSFRTPRHAGEFIDFVVEDFYNLQIFSELLKGMGFTFPARAPRGDLADTKPRIGERQRNATLGRLMKLGRYFRRWAARRLNTGISAVDICAMGCSPSTLRALTRKMRLRVVPFPISDDCLSDRTHLKFDQCRRALGTLPAVGDFERLIVRSLVQNFPSMYLETFRDNRCAVTRGFRSIPPVLVSLSWHWNEAFKFLAAEASERGSRLVAAQHGGGYGVFRYHPQELHESHVADAFMVWGWANGHGSAKNLPSLKLSSLVRSRDQKPICQKSQTILFVGTGQPRYLYRFHSAPVGSQWEHYVSWQLRFLSSVPDQLRSRVLFRPYRREYGHSVRERIARKFAEVRSDCGESFEQSLQQSRIAVIDHCATTFLEALVANIPVILFWDSQRWELREEAEPHFENLRKVGILWDSPEAAAAQLAEVYDRPEAWWTNRNVQNARQIFVEHYALAKRNWMESWAEALNEELSAYTVANNRS